MQPLWGELNSVCEYLLICSLAMTQLLCLAMALSEDVGVGSPYL